MFAGYADYSMTMITTVNEENTIVAAAIRTVLSFVGYAAKRSITNDEQTTLAPLSFTWTNGTNKGSRNGLNFIKEKVQRIFVKRRINLWRLSELS